MIAEYRYVIKRVLFVLLLFFPHYIFAENSLFNSINFFISPRLLAEGSITDFGLGFAFNETLSIDIQYKNTKISKNEELEGVTDSLNAVNETIHEFFLFPVKYHFFDNQKINIWTGAGLFYQYNNLDEKGFFNLPSLETLNPPRERVNSYRNIFSMHLAGPLIESGIRYSSRRLEFGFSGAVVPVFFLHANQTTSIVPLLDPHSAKHSQNTWGSPHFFLGLDSIIFKYVNLAFLYEYSRLKYQFIDFDENLDWITPQRNIINQSFMIEASVLIPIGNNISFQAGYGYTFDSIQLDSASTESSNRRYLIFTVKNR